MLGCKHFGHEDAGVRCRVLDCVMGVFRKKAAYYFEALLFECMTDPESSVRIKALRAVSQGCEDTATGDTNKSGAQAGLSRKQKNLMASRIKSVVPKIVEMTHAASVRAQCLAFETLRRIGPGARFVAEDIIALLAERDPNVRDAALTAINAEAELRAVRDDHSESLESS